MYQSELEKIREEEAKKWSEVISQLGSFQNADEMKLSEKARQIVESIQKKSEENVKVLKESSRNLSGSDKFKTEGSPEKGGNMDIDHILKQLNSANKPKDEGSDQKKPAKGSRNRPDDDYIQRKAIETLSPTENIFKKKKAAPWGKKNLQIDVNMANDEDQGDAQGSKGSEFNLDLSQMRMALGGEMLREQSARTLSQSVSTPSGKKQNLSDLDLPEGDSAEGMSIFERDPFKEFTQKKMKELMHHENMKKIIKMREQALDARHKTHVDYMKKMLDQKRFSPRTF